MAGDTVLIKLSKVTVHGATVASLLYAVTSGGAPCDGLVFGDTVSTTTQHLHDDDDAATTTEARAAVASTLCCSSNCSFYDPTGALDDSMLEDLVRRQPGGPPLLGWLSYRPLPSPSGSASTSTSTSASWGPLSSQAASSTPSSAAALRPSMREAAVTQALLRRELSRQAAAQGGTGCGGGLGGGGAGPMGQQAVLLLLLGGGLDHSGATLSWQLRCFQARQSVATGELLLEPVELQTLNLGGHTGHAAYTQLHAAAAAAPLSLSLSTPIGTPPRRTAPHGSSAAAAAPYSLSPPSAAGSPGFGATAATPPHGSPLGGGGGAAASDADAAAAALAAGARAQVAGVKQHCEAMLASLNELCRAAAGGAVELAELRRRRDELLAQAAARLR